VKKVSRFFYAVLLLLALLFALTACSQPATVPSTLLGLPAGENQSQIPLSGRSASIPKPVVEIVVYSDFECGACVKFHSESEPALRERYVATGEARIDLRLLGAIGPGSLLAAEAALCAADQNRFVEYEDALFNAWLKKDADAYSEEELLKLAADLGLDVDTFRSSLESGSKKGELERNMEMAGEDGVRVLPAVIISGVKIEGHRPLDVYIKLVEQSLKEIGN
jgi:protein-disulfide isomerase